MITISSHLCLILLRNMWKYSINFPRWPLSEAYCRCTQRRTEFPWGYKNWTLGNVTPLISYANRFWICDRAQILAIRLFRYTSKAILIFWAFKDLSGWFVAMRGLPCPCSLGNDVSFRSKRRIGSTNSKKTGYSLASSQWNLKNRVPLVCSCLFSWACLPSTARPPYLRFPSSSSQFESFTIRFDCLCKECTVDRNLCSFAC